MWLFKSIHNLNIKGLTLANFHSVLCIVIYNMNKCILPIIGRYSAFSKITFYNIYIRF